MECSICFESLSSGAFSTSCGHIFCVCIIEYIQNSELCPACNQPQTVSQVNKVFLPHARTSFDGTGDSGFNNAIVQSLVHDLEEEKKKNQQKLSEMQKLLENLTISFTAIDTRHDAIIEENKQLKKEIEDLKAQVKKIVDAEGSIIKEGSSSISDATFLAGL